MKQKFAGQVLKIRNSRTLAAATISRPMRSGWVPAIALAAALTLHVGAAVEESTRDPLRLVAETGSPYFLERERASAAIAELGSAAVPFLAAGLDSENPRTVAGCLTLLDDLVMDGAANPRVMALSAHPDPEVSAAAIRFLAGRPFVCEDGATGEDAGYKAWSEQVLEGGNVGQIRAYLLGVRWPAPAFQTALIAAALSLLPRDLQADAVEAIAKGERSDAAAKLRGVFDRVGEGVLEPRLAGVALEALRDCAAASSIDVVVSGLVSPAPLLREKAHAVLSALRTHLFRLGSYDDLIALNRELCRVFPEDGEAKLDLADSLLLCGRDLAAAEEVLTKLRRAAAGSTSTEARLHDAEALRGFAAAAYLAGKDWKPFLEQPEGGASASNEYFREEEAKALLLQGALIAAGGGDGTPQFFQAIQAAPYEPYSARIDVCLYGRFSVTSLLWRLGRDRQEDSCRRICDQIAAALREESSRCYYYPQPDLLPLIEDRMRSSFPLSRAFVLWNDLGDPAAAIDALDEFAAVVQESTLRDNLELAARAFFLRGAAEMDLTEYARAEASLLKGIEICEDILSTDKTELEKKRTRALESLVEADRERHALGLLQLATLSFLSGRPPDRTEGLVAAAEKASPVPVEVRTARALVLARRGQIGAAAKILTAVEDYRDQFYNKSCLNLWTGRKDKALEYLARHFNESVRPLRLGLARAYARRDPDFEPFGGDPRFLELVGAEK